MPGQIIKEPFWTSMVERNENMNTCGGNLKNIILSMHPYVHNYK